MRIITIGREFGSGGRELGKRLADRLGVPCYDKEVISEVAKLHNMSEEYVDKISPNDIRMVYPSTIGKSFGTYMYYNENAAQAFVSQQEIVKKLAAQGDCVFIGRGADVILEKHNPLNIFVHADKEAKLARCLEHIHEGETEKSILKQMQKIDRNRAHTRNLLTSAPWGDKGSYHLCVNTTGRDIKSLIPGLVRYVNAWFEAQENKNK